MYTFKRLKLSWACYKYYIAAIIVDRGYSSGNRMPFSGTIYPAVQLRKFSRERRKKK